MEFLAKLVPVLLLAGCLAMAGCEKQPEGACIVGSGITAGCTDVNEANCENTLNGTWHSGTTCADLGYVKTLVPSFALSELRTGAGDRAGRIDWVEVVNAGEEAVMLDGFSLVGTTPDGRAADVPLDGVLEPCGVLVIGSPGASEAAHDVDLPFGFAADGSGSGYVALTAHGPAAGFEGVVSAVTFGSAKHAELPGRAEFGQIENLGPVAADRSYVRLGWPANDWAESDRSGPNEADRILGCDVVPGEAMLPAWSPLAPGRY